MDTKGERRRMGKVGRLGLPYIYKYIHIHISHIHIYIYTHKLDTMYEIDD